jgi:hypothetical protein
MRVQWDNRPVIEITRRDVIDLLDAIIDRGAAVQANRTLAVLRRFFNWSLEREIIAVSPIAGLKAPTAEKARDRALTDGEIRLFWVGCDRLGWPFGPMFKLLLLTAQRRDEGGHGMERDRASRQKGVDDPAREGEERPASRGSSFRTHHRDHPRIAQDVTIEGRRCRL